MKPQFLTNRVFMFITGMAMAATGLLFIINPEWLTSLVQVVIGVMLVAIGMLECAFAFADNLKPINRNAMIVIGLSNVLVGALFFIVSDLLVILLGINVFINGAGLVLEAFRWRQAGSAHWFSLVITGVLSVAIGILLVYFSSQLSSILVYVAGGLFLGVGLTLILTCCMAQRKVRQANS